MEEGSLRAYERHVAVVLVAVVTSFGVFSLREKHLQIETQNNEMVSVHIVGAIKECSLVIPRGSYLEDVLKMVSVEKSADITELDGARRIMRDETIVIPYIGTTTLFVTGAVNKSEIIVLRGHVGAQDVLDQVEVRDDANIKSFLRRKKFISGTVVEIKRKRSRMAEKIPR